MTATTNPRISEYRAAIIDLDPAHHLDVSWVDGNGQEASLTALRPTEGEAILAHAMIHHPETGELMAGEVRLQERRLRAAGTATLEFVQRHEKELRVIGVAAVTIAGATGMAVRRFKHHM